MDRPVQQGLQVDAIASTNLPAHPTGIRTSSSPAFEIADESARAASYSPSAERSFGITCLPLLAVSTGLAEGKLVSLLEDYLGETGTFRMPWPTNRYLSPKARAFVEYMAANLSAE